MSDALTQTKDRLYCRLDRKPVAIAPLIADQWVVKSLLQKSIRRGEIDIAQRAALTFLAQKGSAIWRQFMIIAFEDVGAASVDVVAMTVAASTDAGWRKKSGGNAVVASELARLLAQAPKSRSAEHLITSADRHPSLEQDRQSVSNSSIGGNLAAVSDKSCSLLHRALAAWCVSGIDWRPKKNQENDFPALLANFRKLGIPKELVAATGIATAKTREPIALMVPLIWLAANEGQVPLVLEAPVPHASVLRDIPMYALDKHTRIGKEAIRAFVKLNNEVRECLGKLVTPARWHDAAYMAAFYTDAAPLASKLAWQGADQLEAFGTETDLLISGVPPEGHAPLLKVFEENIRQLDDVRVQTFRQKHGIMDRTGGEG